MRPIKAVIISANKKTGLKLRLESGLTAILSYDKKYRKGEGVLISYDFTKNKAVRILEHKEEEEIVTGIEEIVEENTPEDLNHEL